MHYCQWIPAASCNRSASLSQYPSLTAALIQHYDLSCSIAYVSQYKPDWAETDPQHEDQRYSRRLNKLAAGLFWRPSTTRRSISDAIARGNRFCFCAVASQRSKNACVLSGDSAWPSCWAVRKATSAHQAKCASAVAVCSGGKVSWVFFIQKLYRRSRLRGRPGEGSYFQTYINDYLLCLSWSFMASRVMIPIY